MEVTFPGYGLAEGIAREVVKDLGVDLTGLGN